MQVYIFLAKVSTFTLPLQVLYGMLYKMPFQRQNDSKSYSTGVWFAVQMGKNKGCLNS